MEIDPASIGARIGLARILAKRAVNPWQTDTFQQEAVQRDLARGEQLLSEAIASDPSEPMAYAVMGFTRRQQARLPKSRIAVEKALALDPNFEWANMQLGWTLMFLGECEDAIPLAKKAWAEPTRSEHKLSL